MIASALFMIAIAILTRLDGWGPETSAQAEAWPRWKVTVAKSFNQWTCGILAGILTLLIFHDAWLGFIVGGGFVLWRAPELGDYWSPDWHYWPMMFARAALTTLPLFVVLSVYLHGHVFWGWLFIPMGLTQMLLYNGLQRFNREVRVIWWYQLAAELGTGLTFAAFICLIHSYLPSKLGHQLVAPFYG